MEVEQSFCEFCGGTGWQIVLEGSVSRAKRCTCARVISGDRLFDIAKIPPRYMDCDFDSYEAETPRQLRAKSLAKEFALDFTLNNDDERFPEGGILFSGHSGTGKTHLAVSILKTLLKKGNKCLFVDFHDLLAEIRSSYDEISQFSELQILRPVLSCDVLILDDLGSQRMTEWMQDTVFHIVNIRYQQKRSLITTTNLALEPEKGSSKESLRERIGAKVVSRLYEMCAFIELDGTDHRMHRKVSSDANRNRMEPDRT
jgi:DNA replication protein DnaC